MLEKLNREARQAGLQGHFC